MVKYSKEYMKKLRAIGSQTRKLCRQALEKLSPEEKKAMGITNAKEFISKRGREAEWKQHYNNNVKWEYPA